MDIIQVLEYMQSIGVVRLNKIIGDYYSIYCPIHNGGKERRPSCGVLLHDQFRNGRQYRAGFVHCFTCGLAEDMPKFINDLIRNYELKDDEVKKLRDIAEEFETGDVDGDKLISDNLMKSLISKYMVDDIRLRTGTSSVDFISESELRAYRYTVPYMYDRKLTDYLIEKYDVGVDLHFIPKGGKREVPCITFPVRDSHGRTLFILRRALNSKRFFMPEDVQKPVYGLYELPKDCDSVVIVESCFNALTCVRYGKYAVALLGTGTPYQIQQLRQLGVREFILGFDSDDAGERATSRLKRALKDVAIVWRYVGIPDGKDINDLSEDEFNALELE